MTTIALVTTGCANQPSGLFGTWAANEFETTFHKGGLLSVTRSAIRGGAPTDSGTWETNGDLLIISIDGQRGTESRESASTFYAGADQMALTALWPIGTHHGVVGVWKGRDGFGSGHRPFDDRMVETTLELQSDHGCTRTLSNQGIQLCTWSQDASGAVTLSVDPGTTFQLVEDQVLSSAVAERVR